MQLNPAEISELIKSRIGLAAAATSVGHVVSVSDGIVRVHGLSDVMQGEMLGSPPPGPHRSGMASSVTPLAP
jgi:F-type H+-transporting ATPase subunit alpha